MHTGGWGWTRREAGLSSLVEWIDRMQRRMPSQRWGVWGGVVGGGSGLVGGWLAIGSEALGLQTSNWLLWAPVVLWAIGMVAYTVSTLRKVREEQGAWGREARGIMPRLVVARWHGSLAQTLGEEGAKNMNEAASVLLHCQGVLDAPAWKAAAGGETWSAAREKALRAMDSAMARLLMLTVAGGSAEEAEAILSDMREMDAEVVKAAQRHSSVSGIPLEGSIGLRQALAEMRELAQADEEFLEERHS